MSPVTTTVASVATNVGLTRDRSKKRPKGDPLLRYEVDAAGCWLWTGSITGWGYGHLAVDNRFWQAHRYFYTQFRSEIPAGLDLDHLCRIRHCVNPDHLEPVTRRENLLRGEGASARHARQTHCWNGHSLNGENLIIERRKYGLGRRCRICENANQRRRRMSR